MADQTVVYDSCIFYSFTLRTLFVQLAMTGLFRAKWSEEIHDEWIWHVLAVAIQCGAQTIITNNLKDFPEPVLKKFNIEGISPDHFLNDLWDLAPEIVLHSLKKCRERLINPPFNADEYLHSLTKQGFIKSVPRIRPYQSII